MPSREARSKDRIKGARSRRTRQGGCGQEQGKVGLFGKSAYEEATEGGREAQKRGWYAQGHTPVFRRWLQGSSVSSKEKQARSPKKPNLPTGKTLGKEATIEKKKECGPARSSPSRERLTQVKKVVNAFLVTGYNNIARIY
ncbi:hypothetical protein KIN20_003936 [Parelaphostrongylus tenuis]|uniref:Uncharacterized protein n=1 Tax=Parelaphostrongylus tenuis TaxID=148309 RepID=A0AAD5QE23_PARTN|nr:hypothetical protein KIN20_003936 [Parelaphostrongylus tenuis]